MDMVIKIVFHSHRKAAIKGIIISSFFTAFTSLQFVQLEFEKRIHAVEISQREKQTAGQITFLCSPLPSKYSELNCMKTQLPYLSGCVLVG